MTDLVVGRTDPGCAAVHGRRSRRWNDPLVLAAFTALVVGVAWSVRGRSDPAPSEDSVEVGCARDMADYHEQAVELAEILRTRTQDPAMTLLAADIALTRQAQIGQMRGRLESWNRPLTATRPPMAWMGHDGTGEMPGMTTADDIERLRMSDGTDADELFLRLMIRHHRCGALMAAVAAGSSADPDVTALATAIETGQTAEIDAMQNLLEEMGVAPDTSVVCMPPGHGADPGDTNRSNVRLAIVGLAAVPLAALFVEDRRRHRDRP